MTDVADLVEQNMSPAENQDIVQFLMKTLVSNQSNCFPDYSIIIVSYFVNEGFASFFATNRDLFRNLLGITSN